MDAPLVHPNSTDLALVDILCLSVLRFDRYFAGVVFRLALRTKENNPHHPEHLVFMEAPLEVRGFLIYIPFQYEQSGSHAIIQLIRRHQLRNRHCIHEHQALMAVRDVVQQLRKVQSLVAPSALFEDRTLHLAKLTITLMLSDSVIVNNTLKYGGHSESDYPVTSSETFACHKTRQLQLSFVDPPGHGRIGGHYIYTWCPHVRHKHKNSLQL